MQKRTGLTTLCAFALGSGLAAGLVPAQAQAQAPLEVQPDGQVQTSGVAALGVSPKPGQRLGQTGKWQALDLDHTLTALLAEKDVLFSISPRRGGDVFLMFVLKGQEVKDPALSVRFSNGYVAKGFHYTGIINRGTQWGCYVSAAEGRALFEALAESNAVIFSWKGGQKQVSFDRGDEFVQGLKATAKREVMPFPQ